MMGQPTPKAVVRALSGLPMTIIVSLLIGGTMTNRELQDWTGKGKAPVSKALGVLESWGLVENAGKFTGWYLTSTVSQLPLPFKQLVQNIDQDVPVDNFSPSLEKVMLSTGKGRKSTLSPSSSSLKNIRNIEVVEKEEEALTKKVENLPFLTVNDVIGGCADRLQKHSLLVGQGIGATSKKMIEILDLPYSVDDIKAFCMERIAKKKAGEKYPVSWLINKMTSLDLVPTLIEFCDDCGRELLAQYSGWCPCSAIKR